MRPSGCGDLGPRRARGAVAAEPAVASGPAAAAPQAPNGGPGSSLPSLDDALRHRLRAGAYHLARPPCRHRRAADRDRPRRRNAAPCTFTTDSWPPITTMKIRAAGPALFEDARSMNLAEAATFAWTSLMANKTRAGLTMLGMVIGTASIILVVTI